jgi:hypothetical protein
MPPVLIATGRREGNVYFTSSPLFSFVKPNSATTYNNIVVDPFPQTDIAKAVEIERRLV